MTPQEWVRDTLNRWPTGHHVAEGATHLAAALEEITRLRAEAGRVVVPEIPTWDDCEAKVIRGEKRTALEKFVQDHDWQKNDTQFRDGLEAVFDELRAHSVPSSRVLKDGEALVPKLTEEDRATFEGMDAEWGYNLAASRANARTAKP